MWVHVTNNVIDDKFEVLPSAWRNISNLPYFTEAELNAHGWFKVVDSRPTLTQQAPRWINDRVEIINGIPTRLAELEPWTKDEADSYAARTYAKLTALKELTPDQISTWVNNNVTTLAAAQDAIKTLAIAVSILARRL